MNWKTITYWITTGLLAALMLFSAAAYVSGEPHGVAGFHSLGYPDYFRVMLGVAKALGVVALLAPGVRVLKEWAYAGFGFTFFAAVVSHAACGQMDHLAGPVIALIFLAASYYLRPETRRVAEAPHA